MLDGADFPPPVPIPPATRDPFVGAHAATLSAHEEKIVVAIAQAAMPDGHGLPGGGAHTVDRLLRMLRGAPGSWVAGVKALLWLTESSTIPRHGRPLTSLSRDEAEAFLERWSNGRTHLGRTVLRAVLSPIKYAHFDAAEMYSNVGCRYETPALLNEERPRFLEQVIDGREVKEDLELEADVVIVGTGAGGAATAYELARRGVAVLMLEEGDYHRRASFTGRANDMTKLLYRDMGLTIALGNVGIPVWAGRAVGGSTVINSGTCYRAPERVFARWRERYGLLDFSSDSMSDYYARVEEMLQVGIASREHIGGVGRVVERGAKKVGFLHHGPIPRNAPGCDGQGICCFGCPTGAKRSTDVSYVPEALMRGAQLITAAKVDAIDAKDGVARGVGGSLRSGRRFTVKARAVVIAAGTLYTPVLLERARVGIRSKYLGKNLSIHPATKVMALFDEDVDMSRGIPQAYAIEDFADEGLMLEGGSTPFDVTAVSIPWVGKRFMEVMARFRNVAQFGMMIQDVSRGAVRVGPGGKPLITYDLGREDLAKLQRGVVALCKIFRAAGAKRVWPFIVGAHEVESDADVEALANRRLKPSDLEITAFHPLGTCRIGVDPKKSVLRPDHEAHDVKNLYVIDGSAIPSSLGVNPQMTIMAMALRASEKIAEKLA